MLYDRKTAYYYRNRGRESGLRQVVVRVVKHEADCPISDGLIIPPHRCTCGGAERNLAVGYTLQLDA